MSHMVDCPADGCDYSGPKSSVLGHYSGKRDDAHTGGYLEAKEMIDGGEMVTESGEDTSQADSSGSTLNIPQPDETTTETDSDPDPECPGCGRGPDSEAVFESDSYLRAAGDRLPGETAAAISKHDYVCTGCWKGFDS